MSYGRVKANCTTGLQPSCDTYLISSLASLCGMKKTHRGLIRKHLLFPVLMGTILFLCGGQGKLHVSLKDPRLRVTTAGTFKLHARTHEHSHSHTHATRHYKYTHIHRVPLSLTSMYAHHGVCPLKTHDTENTHSLKTHTACLSLSLPLFHTHTHSPTIPHKHVCTPQQAPTEDTQY